MKSGHYSAVIGESGQYSDPGQSGHPGESGQLRGLEGIEGIWSVLGLEGNSDPGILGSRSEMCTSGHYSDGRGAYYYYSADLFLGSI